MTVIINNGLYDVELQKQKDQLINHLYETYNKLIQNFLRIITQHKCYITF